MLLSRLQQDQFLSVIIEIPPRRECENSVMPAQAGIQVRGVVAEGSSSAWIPLSRE
jgi:hypothetical protein